MEERIDTSLATRSLIAWLVTVFATISVLLAGLGIHGVVAQVVTERTAEIGLRMALGARSGDIFKRYVMQALKLSLLRIAIGFCVASGCRAWLQSFLYHVQSVDPTTIILSVLGVLVVCAAAVLAPSWRASHIDPHIALRTE
jgi:putative ABC transport system permease protein